MQRQCEVCASLIGSTDESSSPASDGSRPQRPVYVLVEDRVVALCAEHAAELQAADPQSIDEFRALFRDSGERRSLVERRGPLDRRVFPPRPEGRRRGDGRRDHDEVG
jgi:hypothetical protein